MTIIITICLFILPIIASTLLASDQQLFGNFGDPQQFIWQSSNWINFFNTGQSIINSIYNGLPTPLTLTPTVLFQSLIFSLTNALTDNLIFSYNYTVFFLLSLNLFFWFRYFLSQYNLPIAFLGSILVSLSPFTLFHSAGHMGIFINFHFAFLLTVINSNPNSTRYYPLLGLILALSFWIHEYWGLASLLIILINFLYHQKNNPSFHLKFSNITALLICFLLAASPLVIVYSQQYYWQYVYHLSQRRSIYEGYFYASSLLDYIHPLPHPQNIEKYNYLGLLNLTILAYLLIKFIRHPHLKITLNLVIVLIFLFLSFGTAIKLNNFLIPLPTALLYKINFPLIAQIRAWGRFGFIVYLFISLHSVSFLNKYYIRHYYSAKIIFFAFLLIIIDLFLTQPFVSHRFSLPSFVFDLKKSPPGLVLHLPLVADLGAIHNASAIAWSTLHGQPLVNGYTSFNNPIFNRTLSGSALINFEYRRQLSLNYRPSCSQVTAWLTSQNIKYLIWEKESSVYDYPRFTPADQLVLNSKIKTIFDCFPDNHRSSNSTYELLYL